MLRAGKPFFSESDIVDITSRIASVLRSGWLTSGEVVAQFETEFCSTVGTRFSVALNSCTAALHCIMALLELEPNAEVIVPANTFASTWNAVVYVGSKPVFADCDLRTFDVTVETIEEKITQNTRAVVVVHLGGNPCDMDGIIRLCRERDLVLIEDCAHALGSLYRGNPCGSFGLASAFSFYPTKVITSAEGGMIATNSERIHKEARAFRNVGRDELGPAPIRMLGYNYRMSDIHACVGLNQLRRLREFVRKRNELAKRYDDELRTVNWVQPQEIAGHSSCSYYAYVCRISEDAPLTRDQLAASLREKSIETTIMYRPASLQPYYRTKSRQGECPNADWLGAHSIVLPLHVAMTEQDVLHVVDSLRHASPHG